MATVTTERINGHAVSPRGFERGRPGTRVTSPTTRNVTDNGNLPRAASYTYLPEAKERYGNSAVFQVKGFPEQDDVAQSDDVADISPPDTSPPGSSGWNTPEERAPPIPPPQAREIIAQLRQSSDREQAGQSERSSVRSSLRQSSPESARTVSTVATTPLSTRPRPSVNKSFSRRFTRQSWYQSNPNSPSRSPSPTKQDVAAGPGTHGAVPVQPTDAGRRKSLLTRKSTTKTAREGKEKKESSRSGDEQELDKSIKRRSTFLRRKSSRTRSVISGIAANGPGTARNSMAVDPPPVPAIPGLPKSFSSDRLPLPRSQSAMTADRAAPVPRLLSSDKTLHSSPLSGVIRKKDELWSAFRSLDGDFTKFTSKSSTLKANVVRNALLPFLRTYANHPSNKTLRPEDLDRRANILNKWWTGLIEMLHGRNNQSICGTDRPVILDGISGIMERSEWRLSPSPFCPLTQRIKITLANGNRSNTSLTSSSSEFLTDSVHHNVRNIFVQNLSSQMAFVVDKMSLRNASASLVTFCGKACAYAFTFVPGMADVLVRLWELPMDTLRRVLQENGVGKFDQVSDFSDDIVKNFPPALHHLGFLSLMKFMRKLRTPPPLPVGTTHIEWWGHWVERWSGRESDLFYVFVKHFHILVTDFLPSDSSRKERVCAPGLLLVHAQILTNLDATVHRDANQTQQDSTTGASPTFDEMLGDPDAIAPALPVPPTNAIRLMAENRLIMLIRDFLSERTADHPIARQIFAQSFNDLLQAAARGTSMFDHAACYTLLDFLEEALVILVRFEHLSDNEEPLLDTDFWHTVCKKMIHSENTMTEIRLYAFLYTVWNVVTSISDRRANLCKDILLDPDIFESRFNHWCPMVRAYYMRLLCWRVARHNDEDVSDDLRVLEIMQDRLQYTWSHYLYLREKADDEQALHPTTTPSNPAPGRRLLIVRVDNNTNPSNSFVTFDGLLRDSPNMQKPAWKRTSDGTSILDDLDSRPESSSGVDSEPETPKSIGGFLRRITGIGSKNRSKSRGPETRTPLPASTPPVPDGATALTRVATEEEKPRRSGNTDFSPAKPPAHPVPHRSLSFKFSLEFQPSNKQHTPMRLFPPRLPPPAQIFLQENSRSSCSAQSSTRPVEPRGASVARARYAGRALAEWTMVVGECHNFFERRKNEGVPGNKHVETPTLGVEVFKRPS